MRLFEIERRKTEDELTPDELETRRYMEGRCNVFAIGLHTANPERFKLGYTIEYHSGMPDIPYDPDEWGAEDKTHQDEVRRNPDYWALVHAYVHDLETDKWLDARGSFDSQQEVSSDWGYWPGLGKDIYPGTIEQLASIGTMSHFDEVADEWVIVRGQEYMNQFATQDDLNKAVSFARRKLNLKI